MLFLYGCFLKWWYPTTMGFPTKNDHFGVFWGPPLNETPIWFQREDIIFGRVRRGGRWMFLLTRHWNCMSQIFAIKPFGAHANTSSDAGS